jgi:hypothetical protein
MNPPSHRTRPEAGVAAALIALAGVTRAAPPATAPAFTLPVAPAAEVTPASEIPRRAAAAAAHAQWREREGGADYQPTLTYLRETPVLMMVAAPRETAPRALHRKRAIVQACGFLLDDAAFPRAVICIVEPDPDRPSRPVVRNTEVRRADFTAKLCGESGKSGKSEALRQARDDDDVTLRVCAALRID